MQEKVTETKLETRIEVINSLMQKLNLIAEQTLEAMGVSENEKTGILEHLSKAN